MPIEITRAGPENIPNTVFPEGHVDAANNPAEPPLQHRPHAFALMYGSGGAKIAYGQLFWRIDNLHFDFVNPGSGAPVTFNGVGQGRAIKGFDVEIPHIDGPTGTSMSSDVDGRSGESMPNVYLQLDAFGTVYLYWTVSLEDSDGPQVNSWVEVGGSTSVTDIAAVASANTTHHRLHTLAGIAATEGTTDGTYRIEIGTVNDDASITQKLSSDVFWSTVVMTRTQS